MKWGGYSNEATEKFNKTLGKLFGAKGVSILLAIAVFSLLVGATSKWGF